jgi:putative thiamine transport system substrate-binding protein
MTALSRRAFLAVLGSVPFVGRALASDWSVIEAAARGQTVYFNAWAGSEAVNSYIGWAAGELQSRYGVKLVHVKITDAAEVVRRVRDEVNVGKADGSTDLVWINGENFRAMKQDHLLFGPFAEALPNFRFVDVLGKSTVRRDFTEPTDGLESPWGMAQLTFFGDSAKIARHPRSMAELVEFARANPGRLTYPAPPDFHGTTFLKQVLVETVPDATVLAQEVDAEDFRLRAAPMFALLDVLHPHLWRKGRQFPVSQAQLLQMLADGEVLMAFTFNPNEAANLVDAGRLPPSTIAWQHDKGTIGNSHYLAIPKNAGAKEAAQVVANFLLSPEAQARKADLKVWGDPTVLDLARLSPEQAAAFSALRLPGSVADAGPALSEPHASYVPLIEAAWLERYGA